MMVSTTFSRQVIAAVFALVLGLGVFGASAHAAVSPQLVGNLMAHQTPLQLLLLKYQLQVQANLPAAPSVSSMASGSVTQLILSQAADTYAQAGKNALLSYLKEAGLSGDLASALVEDIQGGRYQANTSVVDALKALSAQK